MPNSSGKNRWRRVGRFDNYHESQAKLLEDDRVKGLAVNVDRFEGTVALTGGVKTAEQKRTDEEIAKNVTGVKKVNNNIVVQR